jgi:predicted amidophosphoribosyltransferase
LLSKSVAKHLDLAWCPDALQRFKRTQALGGMGHTERFAHLRGIIKAHTYRMRRMIGWSALLIDEVMTSGATLTNATEACYAGGADHVSVLTLARAAKDA